MGIKMFVCILVIFTIAAAVKAQFQIPRQRPQFTPSPSFNFNQPTPQLPTFNFNQPTPQVPKFNFNPPKPPSNDFKIFGNGGGSPGQGIDLNLGAQKQIWQSPNGRNTLHGTGTYSQHLGGPYGNSKPNFGGMIGITHNFG